LMKFQLSLLPGKILKECYLVIARCVSPEAVSVPLPVIARSVSDVAISVVGIEIATLRSQ
jgi:hypothetical protein